MFPDDSGKVKYKYDELGSVVSPNSSVSVVTRLCVEFFLMARVFNGPSPRCWGFEIVLRHTTLGTTPMDEWSARRRDIYLTIHNIHNRQTSMPPVGFKPAIPAGERLQTHALDCAAAGIGVWWIHGERELDSRKFPEGSYSVLLHSFQTCCPQPAFYRFCPSHIAAGA
jgi:hypothetical protein